MQYAKYINTIHGHSILLLIVLVFLVGCSAPFSDLQSAKLVGRGMVVSYNLALVWQFTPELCR